MNDNSPYKYLKEMFWPPFHPGRPEGHWSRKNEREWTAEEIVEFLKEELQGQDIFTVKGSRVLVKRPFPPEKVGGIILPNSTRENANRDITVAKVLDWGPDAFRYMRTHPSGPVCNRGDWISFKVYEQTKVDVEEKTGREFDFELLYVYDDKIVGVYKDFPDFFATKR